MMLGRGMSFAAIFVLVFVFRQNAVASPCGVVRIPTEFSAGRAFAAPVASMDNRTLHWWIDSDGDGFEFDDAAARYGTSLPTGNSGMANAKLPHWSNRAWIPALTSSTNSVQLMHRSDVAADPIFRGMDGQLGASWLQHRIWTFDYTRASVVWRCDGSIPHHTRAEEVYLSFAVDRSGKLAGGVQVPRVQLTVGRTTYAATLDTAATVALAASGVKWMGVALPSVRATSFAKRSVLLRWHAEHPQWRFNANAGREPGVAAILVPEISAGRVRFRDVWFTTRPDDDVFAGDDVDLKLGPSAFGRSVLTIDYVHKLAIVQAAM